MMEIISLTCNFIGAHVGDLQDFHHIMKHLVAKLRLFGRPHADKVQAIWAAGDRVCWCDVIGEVVLLEEQQNIIGDAVQHIRFTFDHTRQFWQ